jgi:hypothetical protein
MSPDPFWSLQGGPEVIRMDEGAAWSAWRWWVANADEVRAIGVYVAAEAMACDPEHLEEATAAARQTEGRSAVEQMLSMPDPFSVVVCIRGGLRHQESPPRVAGVAGDPAPGPADPGSDADAGPHAGLHVHPGPPAPRATEGPTLDYGSRGSPAAPGFLPRRSP